MYYVVPPTKFLTFVGKYNTPLHPALFAMALKSMLIENKECYKAFKSDKSVNATEKQNNLQLVRNPNIRMYSFFVLITRLTATLHKGLDSLF